MNNIVIVSIFILTLQSDQSGPFGSSIHASKQKDKPRITTTSKVYRVPVGGVVQLECNSANLGEEYLQIWKNKTRVIFVGSLKIVHDSRLTKVGEKLQLHDVNIWDTGIYTCEIEADADEQISISHFVQVLEPPRLLDTSSPRNLTARAGTTISLKCKTVGHPQPNVTWQKFTAAGGRHQTTISLESELSLQSVSRHSAGIYQCKADNQVGKPKTKIFSLIVTYPPEVSPREPVVHAKVGWSVNLTCNVWANPPPSIRWFSSYSSKELTENSQIIERKVSMAHSTVNGLGRQPFNYAIQFQENGNFVISALTIKPESEQEISNYSCEASNTLGKEETQFTLSGLPSAPVISSAELSANLTSYQLVWKTLSIHKLTQYSILYRKTPAGSIVFAWDNIVINVTEEKDNRDSSGRWVHSFTHLNELQSDTAYGAKIKAENIVGWSGFSDEFLFYTRGKDSRPIESRVLDNEETSDCSRLIINNSAALIYILLFKVIISGFSRMLLQ